MTTVVRYGDRLVALVKGRRRWCWSDCTHYLAADGTAPSPGRREAAAPIAGQLRDAAGQAMRTLAFAYARAAAGHARGRGRAARPPRRLESGLVFVGFVAIRDPLRDDVKEAVDRVPAAPASRSR